MGAAGAAYAAFPVETYVVSPCGAEVHETTRMAARSTRVAGMRCRVIEACKIAAPSSAQREVPVARRGRARTLFAMALIVNGEQIDDEIIEGEFRTIKG